MSFSDWTLSWVGSVVLRGYEGDERNRFLPSKLSSNNVRDRTVTFWEEERRSKVNPSLWLVFLRVIKFELIVGVLFGLLQGLLATVARPLLLKFCIDGLIEGSGGLEYYVIALGAEQILEGLTATFSRHALLDHASSMFFSAAANLIQQKSLRVAHGCTDLSPTTLIGNDVIRTVENAKYMQLYPNSLSSLIGGIAVLLYSVGTSGLVGLAASAIILAANAYIATFARDAEEENLAAADVRLGVMKQIIESIKAIKLSAWEQRFGELLSSARKKECGPLYRFRFYLQSSVQLGRASPIIAACITFLFKTLILGETLRASDTFAALNVFLSLRLALIIIPECVTYFAAASISIKRIQQYLLLPESKTKTTNTSAEEDEEVTFRWPEKITSKHTDDETLKNVVVHPMKPVKNTFVLHTKNIPLNKRIALLGPCGSGKTGFLMSLLGEMNCNRMQRNLSSNFGYVPQHPFVISGTIRENILMGRDFSKDRYDTVLKQSTLISDLNMFPSKDHTVVGERGVTLSGGQKQRLCLARAFYHENVEILLLDDPLSAVDTVVCQKLFHDAILPFTENKTLVMALNQLHLCTHFDLVYVIERGRVVESGDPKNLLRRRKGAFFDLMKHETSEECNDDDDDDDDKKTNDDGDDKKTNDDDDDKKTNDDEKDMKEEAVDKKSYIKKQRLERGGFGFDIFKKYVKGMGYLNTLLAVATTFSAYATMVVLDFTLSRWVNHYEKNGNELDLSYPIQYSILCVVFVFLLVLSSKLFASAGVRSSKSLHELCVDKLLRAPVDWFNRTPSGRILSRFSSDLSMVDQNVPRFADNFVQFFATLVALTLMVCVLIPTMIGPFVLATIIYGVEIHYVNIATRDAKREANNDMAPLQSIANEGSNGRVVIRSMHFQNYFEKKFKSAVDRWNHDSYVGLCVTTWAQSVSYILSFFIATCTATFIVTQRTKYDASNAALSLTYAFLIPYFLLHFCFIINQLNVSFTSLERLLFYSSDFIPQEDSWRKPECDPPTFPTKGTIRFVDASLRYRPDLPEALRHIDLSIEAGERVAVVGRTGAGKSSLLTLLFRLNEPSTGYVEIDGYDVKTLGLLTLRESISVVPQEPLLMRGSVRTNLDPFDCIDDASLSQVLENVGLNQSVLSQTDADASQILSGGERQMLSLARALLSNARIMVCDEPTSNVDMYNDRKIQDILRAHVVSKKCTLITIAHRLQTIADYDKVLVMDKGTVKEFDSPRTLLRDKNSVLYSMAFRSGGDEMVQNLLSISG